MTTPPNADPNGTFDPSLGASYRLVREIGSGASGQVWLALDTRTDEDVAAKLLRPEHATDHDIVTRFVGERSVLTSLRHPGIVAVRDLVVEGDRVAIVMDFVAGGALRDILDSERTLPPYVAAEVVALVLDALAEAHARGVLHRDVKPDNILLTREWSGLETGSVRLTDFGIARLVETQIRRTTGLLGTPEYMPPEFIATGDCDLPGDVYASGIMLYELLTGRTPFAGPGSAFTVAQRHLTAHPPEIPVPPALWSLLEGLLDKNPDARPTAAQAAAQLRRVSPALRDLAPLEPAAAPSDFDTIARPATVLRGSTGAHAPSPDEVDDERGPFEDAPDLGEASHATVYRARPQGLRSSVPAEAAAWPSRPKRKPFWKSPMVLSLVGASAVLAVAVTYLVLNPAKPSKPTASAPAAGQVAARSQDRSLPTGLTVARSASWKASDQTVTLTLSYSAQNATLSGTVLEVLPGATKGSACPAVTWPDGAQSRNLPSASGIDAPCSWSVDVGTIAAQETRAVKASFRLPLAGDDAGAALQAWLDGAGAATTDAINDSSVTTTSYPIQRLRDIAVTTPPAIVTETSVPIALVPVWPSGADPLNPLLQTSSISAPADSLTAIAGGSSGVRFSDGCGGALAVSSNGLNVTTLTETPSCVVNARVGNFADLASQPFAIVIRGG